MGVVIEIGGNVKANREAQSCNDFSKELEEELMKYTADYEEKIEETQRTGRESEVRITGRVECGANEMVEECLDATESSSSFGDSDYGVESAGEGIESEASSTFRAQTASEMDCDNIGELVRPGRKKKMTDDWRIYIQPLEWRCKWLELQIKKLESVAQAYERKLEACDHGASHSHSRTEVLRRKKRRRVESITDIAAYMAHHNLFSYYENQKHYADNRLRSAHVSSRDNEFKKLEATQEANALHELWGNEKESCAAGDPDTLPERIFCKIDNLQARVGQLKSRIKETSQKAEQLRCSANLVLPVDRNCLSVSPSPSEDEMTITAYITSQLMAAEYNMESVALDYGEILLDSNGFQYHAYLQEALGDGYDKFLIDNHKAVNEMKSFEQLKIEPSQSPVRHENLLKSAYPPAVYKPDQPYHCQQLPPKVPLISRLASAPKSKCRKRGQRGGRR